jgi:hypothetical protein
MKIGGSLIFYQFILHKKYKSTLIYGNIYKELGSRKTQKTVFAGDGQQTENIHPRMLTKSNLKALSAN